MLTTIFTAVISFISTNIDDIFVLMILYTQAKDRRDIMHIIAGQYLGICVLFAISVLGALGAQLFFSQYIRYLGFLPLFLGLKLLINYHNEKTDDKEEKESSRQISIISVALIAIANGADNICVYIPIFSYYSSLDFVITFIIFCLMIAIWCYLGFALVSYPYINDKIVRYQHIIVPAVFIVLGILILF